MNKKEFLRERLKGIDYIQSEKCAGCRKCCENCGCSVLPMDIEPFSTTSVIKEIDAGKYSIALEVLGCGVTFLGLQARECDSGIIDIYKPHTRCALLTEQGCMFDEEDRPAFALAFVPGNPCEKKISNEEYYQMWGEEQVIMEEVLRHFSNGKSSSQVMHEHFDKVAMEIYEMLLNKTKSRDYFRIVKASIMMGENLYRKIIRISNSEGTTSDIIARLVNLEADKQISTQDRNGYDLAKKLLQFDAYGMLDKSSWVASIEEKVAACIEYNNTYIS